jgi:hypothetical protein
MTIILFRFIYAERQSFSFNDFSFFLSSTFPEDGFVANTGLEYNYTDVLSRRINFRNTNISKNEELLNVQDVLPKPNLPFFRQAYKVVQSLTA